MTIDELVGKQLRYQDGFTIEKSIKCIDSDNPYYICTDDKYFASIEKITNTEMHWFTYIFHTRLTGSIPFSEIIIINQ